MATQGTIGLPARASPFVDEQKLITNYWYSVFVNLIRGVGALGPSATSQTIAGWGTSTGGARTAINGGFTQTAAGGYSQSDTQALINQVEALSKALAQALTDLETFKVLGS